MNIFDEAMKRTDERTRHTGAVQFAERLIERLQNDIEFYERCKSRDNLIRSEVLQQVIAEIRRMTDAD